jgi:multidrug efflux pump subunit AcrA (membrane-fusion protein)
VVPGFISQVGALAQQGNAFSVKADLLEHSHDIRSGMTAQVTFHLHGPTKQQASYLIPLTALDLRHAAGNAEGMQKDAGGQRRAWVLVIDPADMTLESREIRVRDITDNKVNVVQGLTAGERVVIAGVAFLEPGEKVSLWRPVVSSAGAAIP